VLEPVSAAGSSDAGVRSEDEDNTGSSDAPGSLVPGGCDPAEHAEETQEVQEVRETEDTQGT